MQEIAEVFKGNEDYKTQTETWLVKLRDSPSKVKISDETLRSYLKGLGYTNEMIIDFYKRWDIEN